MNVFLLRDVLSERYNSHYTELRNKLINLSTKGPLCINCNPHSSRAVGHSMQKSLKLKFQNAVNQIAFADGDTPALFVGGRRRNRKKRKNKNGQNKKKTKKETEQEAPILLTSVTPDFEYYEDFKPRKSTVSCLDIEEPMFIYEPVKNKQTLITVQTEYDSLYNSNESLDSTKTRRDSGCEDEEKLTDDDDDDNNSNDHVEANNTIKDKIDETVKFPRLHSRDSGVYDDVEDDVTSVDDAGFYDESVDESLVSTSDESEVVASIKDELAKAESDLVSSADVTGDDETFEEIDLTNNDEDESEQDNVNSTVESNNVQNEIKIITEIDHISDREHFLNIVDDDDDIIFDISQLELNTTQDDISNIGKENFQLNHDKGSSRGRVIDSNCSIKTSYNTKPACLH
ncbi:hypothetical protein ACF0H5_013837 [Mactra antiquata]